LWELSRTISEGRDKLTELDSINMNSQRVDFLLLRVVYFYYLLALNPSNMTGVYLFIRKLVYYVLPLWDKTCSARSPGDLARSPFPVSNSPREIWLYITYYIIKNTWRHVIFLLFKKRYLFVFFCFVLSIFINYLN